MYAPLSPWPRSHSGTEPGPAVTLPPLGSPAPTSGAGSTIINIQKNYIPHSSTNKRMTGYPRVGSTYISTNYRITVHVTPLVENIVKETKNNIIVRQVINF